MSSATGVQLQEILAVFTDEITRRSGQVIDVFVAPSYVQARSVFPRFAEARPGDQLQAGVALRAARGDVRVSPYLFRLACQNGAIRVEAVQSRRLVGLEALQATQALEVIRQAIVGCCAEEAFTEAMARVRDGADPRAADAIQNMIIMAHLVRLAQAGEVAETKARVVQTGDRTRYGLGNAITSVARDTRDRRRRWDLEELGGAVLAGDIGVPPHRGPLAARATSRCDEPARL